MKNISIHIVLISLLASVILNGCIKEEQINTPADSQEVTLRITANLSNGDPATRLNYFESGKSLKAYWSSDDQLVANGDPGSTSYYYIFDLVDGANTSTGVFECTASTTGRLPHYLQTNAWTIYFPGSKIVCESDYLNFSYSGQVQKGNNSLEHLKDFHTIRLQCTDGSTESSTVFQDAFIDFSGDGYDESSCMKFQLTGLPSVTPTEVSLKYTAPSGYSSQCFHTYNYLDRYWSGSSSPNPTVSDKISIRLDEFAPCTEANVYMMMSNYPVELQAGGKLTVSVKTKEGKLLSCQKTLRSDVTLEGGRLHRISGSEWTETMVENIDGFDDPDNGIVVLQEATKGTGTDIIIMGDGFSKTHFGKNGNYDRIMNKAYEDLFSVEPYASLQDYFNVYYINAVSEEDHDARPLTNGAVQGKANTVFSTQFKQNSTSITGYNEAVLSYAQQVIRYKGGKGGSKCTDESEILTRVNSSLMVVMVNVACHAGTCSMVFSSRNDYCTEHSVAYCSLSDNEEHRRLTLIHEAGGHGFGKLADEYDGSFINSFSTGDWNNLINYHGWGVYRNVNEHWTAQEKADGWNNELRDTYTDESNVYWTELFDPDYDYTSSEGLGIYRGAFTYNNLYCRSTYNSLMRDQFSSDGNYFNAISRWAIWYRLMKLTAGTSATDFKSSLNEFIAFDNTLTIDMSSTPMTRTSETEGLLPLAPPVLIEID
jgi:hypothetical protein